MTNLGREQSQLHGQEVPVKSGAMTCRHWGLKETLNGPHFKSIRHQRLEESLRESHHRSSQLLLIPKPGQETHCPQEAPIFFYYL